jgi:predicted ATP-binding protein involved in virulence
MFLKKIHFDHYKGFADLELNFETEDRTLRGQTLYLGENGMGKSNLLKGIALVTAGSTALGDLLGDPDDWIEFGEKKCVLTAWMQTQEQEERKIQLTIQRGHDLREIILENRESLSKIDEALKHSDRSYFTVGYGASRRLNKNETNSRGSESRHSRRAQAVMTLFDSDAALNPLSSWAMDLDYGSDGQQLATIKDALNDFLPDLKFDHIDKKKGEVLFKSAYHDHPVPLSLLSDGYQNMASWIGDLLYRVTTRFDDYKDPLKTRGLLLIDEVDLHLHPKWQRILLDFIESKLPNFQLIATTHSPLTAQQSDEGELFVLVRENEHVAVKPFAGSPRLMQVSQLLMSPMFGLATDESRQVENLKNAYVQLKDNPVENKTEEFKKLKNQIEELPVQPLKSDVFLKEKEEMINRLSKKNKIDLK